MGIERGPVSINEWIRTQRDLLRLERNEEKAQVSQTITDLSAQECMERGISLVPLAVEGVSTGLYGRACVTVADPKGRPLPAHRLGAGDEVRLYSTKGSKGDKGEDADKGVTEISGVVGKVTEATVEVISEDADEAGSLRAPLRLDVVASEATHKKLMMGLDALEKYPGGGPAERVINVLFGLESPSSVGAGGAAPSPPSPPAAAAADDDAASGPAAVSTAAKSSALSSLNDSQREAVAFALATRDVALIHGPPGTGKTTTVVALVREAVALGWRCLVCAPSNVAVDGILERLVAAEAVGNGSGDGDGGTSGGGGGGHGGRKNGGRPRVVRMGHPARLLPQVLEHSMEALVSRHEGTAIVKDVRHEIDKLLLQLYGEPGAGSGGGGRGGRGGNKPRPRTRGADRKAARQEVKTLRKEARAREGKVVREVLRSRDVVLATCVGAATYSLREEEFDLVVIDEAAQALEAACWIPTLKGRRLVLAGDHKQLAPTVKSQKAEAGTLSSPPGTDKDKGAATSAAAAGGGVGIGIGGDGPDGLGLTMFDRVLRDLGHGVCRMLDVQYRMNRDICDWASNEMYGGLLRAHASCAERELPDLPHAREAAAEEMEMWAAVMLLVDTTGCDMPEEAAGGGSRRNEREAELAVRHVKGLLEAGVLETEVAVISPYNGQVNLLKQLLRPEHPGVEVRSVDGFQGGEKEAIVLSLVRSNPGRKVGFLADARRLNVAVTRAKRHVAVICDVECCGSDPFICRLLRHIEERGEYRSALELQPPDEDVGEAPPTAAIGGGGGGGGRVVEATASAATGTMGGNKVRRGGRDGEGAAEETISDEEVLKRVQEFAQRGGGGAKEGGREGRGFCEDGAEEEEKLELPSKLTARQRALVHETAEWLGLGHVSTGEGRHRALVLSRGGVGGRGASVEESPDSVFGEDSASDGSTADEQDAGGGSSPFSTLAEAEAEEEEEGEKGSAYDAEVPPAAAAATGAVRPSQVAVPPSTGSGAQGSNALLKALHEERAARRPPAPPSSQGGRKKAGKGKAAAAAAGGRGADAGVDDRGFGVDLPGGGGGGGSGAAKKSASKKGGSGSKKGKKKSSGAGAGARGAAGVKSGGGRGGKGKGKGAAGASDNHRGDDEDDDLAFLDAQIRKERASEPCYASLLRSTTEAMRANNPRWAAEEDKRKPANSSISGARRAQLKGALETKLTEQEKKRGKSTADKKEKKT